MYFLSWGASFVSRRLLWTSEQFVFLSELVLDHPLASSLTALLLTIATCWWLVSFCCCRRLPTKRKESETPKKEVEEIMSPVQRLRKRDIVRQISKKMIRKAHAELGLHLPRRPSFPFRSPPKGSSELQMHKEPPDAFLEADFLLESDTQIPHDVMYLLKSVRVFGHFEKPLFMELCKHVETKFVPAGAILFRPGQVDDSIYVVQNGQLEVFLIEPDGSELPLKEAGTGESVHSLLSIMDAIVGQPNTFKHVFARATRDTYVLQVKSKAFSQFFDRNPDSLLRIIQIIMLRLQRVTFLALNQFLGLSHELMNQKVLCPPDMHIYKLKRLLARGTDNSPIRTGLPQQSVGAGDGVGGVDGSGEVGGFLQKDQLVSDSPTSILSEEQDSTGEEREENTQKRKMVAIDTSQNEEFSHRLLPSQSLEFDNVINQARVDRMEFGGSQPSRAFLTQNIPLKYSHFVSLDSSEILEAATKDLIRIFQLKDDALLKGRIQLIEVAANTILGHEGDLDSCVYFIVSGRLKVLRKRSSAEDLLYVSVPGEFVGALSALTGEPSFISVKAAVHSHLITITKSNLYLILSEHPLAVCGIAVDLVRRLSPFVRQMDFALDWMELEAGRALYKQGDESNSAYIILNGRLRSVIKNANGKKQLVDEFGRGEAVGVVEVMTKSERATTVHAIRDTEIACLPVGLLGAIKVKQPQVVSRLIQLLGQRIIGTFNRLSNFTPSVASNIESVPLNKHMVSNLSTVAVVPMTPDIHLSLFTQLLCSAVNNIVPAQRLTSSLVQEELGSSALESVHEYRLRTWLAHQEDLHRIIIYEADSSLTTWTARCIRQADCILLVANADKSPNSELMGQTLKQVEQISARVRKELVLLHHDETKKPVGTVKWLNTLGWLSSFFHVRCPTVMFGSRSTEEDEKGPISPPHKHSDFARLARRLTGTSVGLVLGGGGARGLSHTGLIRAFREAGVPIDMVGGTSIGALVGALYCDDCDVDKMLERTRVFSGKMAAYKDKLFDLTWPTTSMFTGRSFNRIIYGVFGEKQIEDLWLPYFCVTTDITESKMKVHTSGCLWRYVRASMSLSGYLPPLCDPMDGHLLLDGGYVNNLPADLMASCGAETIIAVDVGAEDNNDLTNYGDQISGWSLLWNRLNPFAKKWRVPTITEIQSRLAYVSCMRQLEAVKNDTTCEYIRPPIDGIATLQFGQFEEVSRIGYRHCKTVIAGWSKREEMKRLLADRMEKRASHSKSPLEKESNMQKRVASIHDLAALAAEIPRQRKPVEDGTNETDGRMKEDQDEEDEPKGYWSNPETNVLFSTQSGEDSATLDIDDSDKKLLVHYSDSELH